MTSLTKNKATYNMSFWKRVEYFIKEKAHLTMFSVTFTTLYKVILRFSCLSLRQFYWLPYLLFCNNILPQLPFFGFLSHSLSSTTFFTSGTDPLHNFFLLLIFRNKGNKLSQEHKTFYKYIALLWFNSYWSIYFVIQPNFIIKSFFLDYIYK